MSIVKITRNFIDSIEDGKSFIEATSNDYISSISNLNQLGLTSQVSNIITVASNQSSRKVKLQNTTIKLVQKRNQSSKKDIKLLQLLDAINSIKKIPDTSINDALKMIMTMIEKLEKKEQQSLAKLALTYSSRTKALLGAILENIGLWDEAYKIKSTLNPLSTYKLSINKELLPTKSEWRIVT